MLHSHSRRSIRQNPRQAPRRASIPPRSSVWPWQEDPRPSPSTLRHRACTPHPAVRRVSSVSPSAPLPRQPLAPGPAVCSRGLCRGVFGLRGWEEGPERALSLLCRVHSIIIASLAPFRSSRTPMTTTAVCFVGLPAAACSCGPPSCGPTCVAGLLRAGPRPTHPPPSRSLLRPPHSLARFLATRYSPPSPAPGCVPRGGGGETRRGRDGGGARLGLCLGVMSRDPPEAGSSDGGCQRYTVGGPGRGPVASLIAHRPKHGREMPMGMTD